MYEDDLDEDFGESEMGDDLDSDGEDCVCPPPGDDGFDLDQDDGDLESMLEFATDDEAIGDEEFEDFDDDLGDEDFDEMNNELSEDDELGDEFDDSLSDELDDEMGDGDDVEEPDIVDEDELDDEEDPDDFLDEEETDIAHAGRGASRRKSSRRASRNSRDFSLEDTESIEDQIGGLSDLEGDDLEALMGAKVTRTASANRGAEGHVARVSANDRLEGFTWDTENEPELAGRKVKATRTKPATKSPRRIAAPRLEESKIRRPKVRKASKPPVFAPDRRRVASGRQAAAGDEFDNVFGEPDVGSFFSD